jgi:hypothetical protein
MHMKAIIRTSHKRLSSSVVIGAALCVMTITANAQTKEQQTRIDSIHQQYQESVRWVEESQMNNETNNSMAIDIRKVTAEGRTQIKRYEFYYSPVGDKDEWRLYFVRLTYNINSRRYNEEFLFDNRTEELIYAAKKFESNNYKEGEKEEYMSYFNADGTPCYTKGVVRRNNGKTYIPSEMKEAIANGEKIEEAKLAGKDVKEIFKKLVN